MLQMQIHPPAIQVELSQEAKQRLRNQWDKLHEGATDRAVAHTWVGLDTIENRRIVSNDQASQRLRTAQNPIEPRLTSNTKGVVAKDTASATETANAPTTTKASSELAPGADTGQLVDTLALSLEVDTLHTDEANDQRRFAGAVPSLLDLLLTLGLSHEAAIQCVHVAPDQRECPPMRVKRVTGSYLDITGVQRYTIRSGSRVQVLNDHGDVLARGVVTTVAQDEAVVEVDSRRGYDSLKAGQKVVVVEI
jgi:hypothetical protein